MDIIVWVLTGGAVGWAAFALLGYNGERGVKTAVVIGAVGGLIGAEAIAPMFFTMPAGSFDLFGVLFAATAAAALVAVGDMVYGRWGV